MSDHAVSSAEQPFQPEDFRGRGLLWDKPPPASRAGLEELRLGRFSDGPEVVGAFRKLGCTAGASARARSRTAIGSQRSAFAGVTARAWRPRDSSSA